MSIEILMPALSPTMTEGTLARWLKKEGDAVKSGDILAEIETDKATMEFEAVDEGVLGKILVSAGTSGVAVNTPIAVLLEEGETAADIKVSASAPVRAVAPVVQALALTAAPAAVPVPVPRPAGEDLAGGAGNRGSRVFASPLARRLAAEKGLDLSRITGSGPHGRIVRADVDSAKAVPVAAAAGTGAVVLEPNSSMRRTIARRLTESKTTVPHFYITVDCQIDTLLKGRAALNAANDGLKLSVNDFVIRAVAVAMKRVPAVNASWGDEAMTRYTDIDISVAVATDGGLITPVIRQADRKGLADISAEVKTLAAKGRDGKLAPHEYQGGGFTISNLGMYGVKEFSAIINPPQACILAVGAGEQRPVVKDGALAIATVMTCTLSADHRVVDGAVGAQFMAVFKALIEEPLGMLL